MKSFRTLIVIIVIVVTLLLSFAIAINFLYVKPILILWEDISNNIVKFNETYTEADLNIRVMDNVVAQIASSQELNNDRYYRIVEAYQENYESLKNKSIELNNLNIQSEQSLLKLESYILSNSVMGLDNVINAFQSMISETEKIRIDILSLSNIDMENQETHINSLQNSYEDLKQSINDLRIQYSETNRYVVPNLINILNSIYIFSFLIMLALVFLINKIVGQDIKYMIDSLKAINSNEYEQSKLPQLKGIFKEEKTIIRFVEGIFNERYYLKELKEILSAEYLFDEIINKLLILIRNSLNTDRIGVAFIDYSTQSIVAEHGAINYGKILLGPGFSVNFNETRLTTLIDTKKPILTNSIQNELAKRPDSTSLKLLNEEGIQSNMILPLVINNTVIGFMFFSSVYEYNYDKKALKLGMKIADELSNILDNTYLTKKMFSTVTRTFSRLVEKKDNETGDHIIRMTEYSRVIAEELVKHEDRRYRVNDRFLNDIINYASIHDIGKIGIPDSILKKPGKLTEEERDVMKQHAVIGANILEELEQSLKIFNREFYKTAIDIARSHHERWDGRGYPEGLSGQNIPLSARIVSIADVFDALSSKRVYKDSFGFDQSVEIINQGLGTQFDPELVRVFNSILPRIKEIYEVESFAEKSAS